MSKVTLTDSSLKHISLELYPELEKLKKAYFRAVPEMCVERSELITKYHLENGLFTQEKISVLDKARAYRYVLRNRSIAIQKSYRPLRRLDLLRRKTCQ
jgi:hypothetical protein